MNSAIDIKKRYRVLVILIVAGIFIIICLLLGFHIIKTKFWTKVDINSGRIDITDIRLTTSLTQDGKAVDNITEFSEIQPRIYCVVTVTSPKPIVLTAKWYHEGKMIREDRAVVEKTVVFYIQPMEGSFLSRGDYKIDLYLYDFPNDLRTINFSVIGDKP